MSPTRERLIHRHVNCLDAPSGGEAALLPHLVGWLIATGRIRSRTRVAYEVPWLGRRVDLALLTARGTTSAFELKLGGLQRVLEQASYNELSFHRSWVVVGNRPQSMGVEWAQRLGLGLILICPPSVELLVQPRGGSPDPTISKRVRSAISDRAAIIP
jgi:hypothetical protein